MMGGGRGPTNTALAISYEGRPSAMLEAVVDLCDAVEIVPDCFLDNGTDRISHRQADEICRLANGKQIFAHGIGLSIGTISGWNTNYLGTIESTLELFPIDHFSEHLGFTTVEGHFLGCMPAVQRTMQFVDLIGERAADLRSRFNLDFIFEHVASPIDSGGDMTHAAFLNAVSEATNSGLILDLHNLECEADNGRIDLDLFFEEFDVSHVAEIHLAGGIWRDGMHLDVHSRTCIRSTMNLFEATISKCTNLKLVVFELLAQAVTAIGHEAIREQLRTIKRSIGVALESGMSLESDVDFTATTGSPATGA